MTSAPPQTCSRCRFWSEYEDCRRNPPGALPETREALWPRTNPLDWCGEFRPRPIRRESPKETA